MLDKFKIISGSSHGEFTQAICEQLHCQLTPIEKICFSNDNMMVRILENVRGCDVFLVQTANKPVSDNIVELFLLLDALKHASAERITAVLPYYPYVRSDKKDEPRISIAARLMANLMQTAGADRVLTMELHSPQIQGFFSIPCDQLFATDTICNYIKKRDLTLTVLVAADVGESKHLGMYTNILNIPIAIVDKRRIGHTEKIIPTNLIGDVQGKNVLIVDDECTSAGTLCGAAKFLKEKGALSISAAIVHPILSGGAIDRINDSCLDELIVTDTLPIAEKHTLCKKKITVLSVAPLFAQAIKRIHHGSSVSVLFGSS